MSRFSKPLIDDVEESSLEQVTQDTQRESIAYTATNMMQKHGLAAAFDKAYDNKTRNKVRGNDSLTLFWSDVCDYLVGRME